MTGFGGMQRLFDVEPILPPNGAAVARMTTRLGGLSEMYAAAKLSDLGHNVAKPLMDDGGVDLVVDYRWRLQVKSATHELDRSGRDRCQFSFNCYPVPGGERRNRLFDADFFVCHGRQPDAWWVVPRDRLLETGFTVYSHALSLMVEPRYKTKWARLSTECRDAWHLIGDAA